MRLGDLDALRKNMEFICMGVMAGTEPYNAPLTEIDNAPTVTSKQGEWINTSPYDDKGECSLCCYVSKKYYNFCPNCGVKMQKGETE